MAFSFTKKKSSNSCSINIDLLHRSIYPPPQLLSNGASQALSAGASPGLSAEDSQALSTGNSPALSQGDFDTSNCVNTPSSSFKDLDATSLMLSDEFDVPCCGVGCARAVVCQ